MSVTVAAADKFKPLAGLPPSVAVDEATILRRIVPEDAEAFARIITDNPDIGKYVTWASMVHDSNDVVPALRSRTHGTMLGRYALVHEDLIIGYGGVFPGERDDEYGIGAFVDKPARRMGYAGKSIEKLIDIAKANLSPRHIYAQIATENTPSIALATQLGFQPAETVWDPNLGLDEQRFRLEISNGQA